MRFLLPLTGVFYYFSNTREIDYYLLYPVWLFLQILTI